jgi:hypothetical protein
MKETYSWAGKMFALYESYVPSLNKAELGLEIVTKDIMMVKEHHN